MNINDVDIICGHNGYIGLIS